MVFTLPFLLLYSAIFFTLIQQPLYFIGLEYSTAANASLIYAAAPLTTMVLEAAFLKTRMQAVKLAGAALGFAGVLIIVQNGAHSWQISIGDIYLLIAMLGLSVNVLFTPRLARTLSPFTITLYSFLIGTLLMAPTFGGEWLLGAAEMNASAVMWLLVGVAGLINVATGIWWVRGVAVVGPGTASLFHNLPPFVAMLAGFLVLGEQVLLSQILGGVLILLGVFISNRARPVKAAPPQTAEPVQPQIPVVQNLLDSVQAATAADGEKAKI
ncbi:DMT family transporter [Paenibacillus pinihumi]|uniref:DMT family transporter n=1 Tax=Paenibacillus pinihumi TaxID=669462 RepID=UPI000AC265B6|nr:EamA family transporter [Paenibacillus pinihumi]